MTGIPAGAWYTDAEVERIARVLWEDAIQTGETDASWEQSKQELRRKALLVIQELWWSTP